MQVLWTEATKELKMSGRQPELLGFVQALRSGEQTRALDASVDPAPYDKALSLLRVERTSGKASALVSNGEVLVVSGGSTALEALAETVEDYALEGDYSIPLQLEYLPGHEFIGEDLNSLVVSLVGPVA